MNELLCNATTVKRLPRNDPRQYDDLAEYWWDERGPFTSLRWIAEARAALIPQANRAEAVLIDLACGGGLLGPFVASKGYRHVGFDITISALEQARAHGLDVVNGDVHRLPFPDACADVVCAGEILEHVRDLETVIKEATRILRPNGLLVIDTIANTALARFVAVTIGERMSGGPPAGIHDPDLFVDRDELVRLCAQQGVNVRIQGLRPIVSAVLAWKLGRTSHVRLIPTNNTRVLFQAWGRKT